MKVVLISNFYNPYIIGGAELVVENYVNALSKKINSIVLITSTERNKECITDVNDNIKIYKIFPNNIYFNYPLKNNRNKIIKYMWWTINLWNPFIYFKIKKILDEEKPDLINIHNYFTLSPSVFNAAFSLKCPVIYTAHDYYSLCKNSSFLKNGNICVKRCLSCRLLGWWNKLFMKNVIYHFLSSYSKYVFDKYISIDKHIILHNSSYYDEGTIKDNIENKYKENNDNIIRYLYLGRLSKHKGIITLLEAFLKVRNDNVMLLIGGEGEQKTEVESYIKRDKRIRYLGFVSGKNKKDVLLKADVFILPSEWYEVSPLAIQEAYAFGLPVIASNIGSIPEHIIVNRTGWLFRKGDAEDLTEKIEYVSNNRDVLMDMSKACFNSALNSNTDKNIDTIIKYWKELLNSRRNPS